MSKLSPDTHVGIVSLNVADLERMSAFYVTGVGLQPLSRSDTEVVLGSRSQPLLELHHRPDLPDAAAGAAGLYHTAVLFERRADLAAALYATATSTAGAAGAGAGAAGSGSVGIYTGSADHLVSLAFYFNDPEGNGVELYWDRPREEWEWKAGEVTMSSLPLDPNQFIAEHREGEGEPRAPHGAAATIGHVHLKVGDIAAARAFYVDALGLDVTMGSWPSALFTSAGGYHHHVGMNVWESRGAGQRSEALGLERFSLVVPASSDVAAAAARLEAAGTVVERNGERALTTTDPWGTVVEVVSES